MAVINQSPFTISETAKQKKWVDIWEKMRVFLHLLATNHPGCGVLVKSIETAIERKRQATQKPISAEDKSQIAIQELGSANKEQRRAIKQTAVQIAATNANEDQLQTVTKIKPVADAATALANRLAATIHEYAEGIGLSGQHKKAIPAMLTGFSTYRADATDFAEDVVTAPATKADVGIAETAAKRKILAPVG